MFGEMLNKVKHLFFLPNKFHKILRSAQNVKPPALSIGALY